LSKLSAPGRVFLSAYVHGKDGRRALERRLKETRRLLDGRELEHFEENVRLLEASLAEEGVSPEGACFFVCWAADLMERREPGIPGVNLFVADSSPYLRPLAEQLDEYEDFAVVAADNSRAKISLVSAGRVKSEAKVRGGVKNHVKVGGWSQQRYERRRDKQLLHYAKEISSRLQALEKETRFRRIVMVGSKETLEELCRHLPKALAKKVVGRKALQLGKSGAWADKEVFELFFREERRSEKDLWSRIKDEHLKGGLAAVGPEAVREAAGQGRVQTMLALRRLDLKGARCSECEDLSLGRTESCPACGSGWLHEVDFVEELVELVAAHDGETDFCDPVGGLKEAGGVAALLRWREGP